MLRFIVRLIAYFAFPFTLVSLIYSVMGLLAENVLRGPTLASLQAGFIIVTGPLAIAFTIFAIGVSRAERMQGERALAVPMFRWVLIYAVAMAVLMLAGHIGTSPPRRLHGPNSRLHPVVCERDIWQALSMHAVPQRDGPVGCALQVFMQSTGLQVDHLYWVSRACSRSTWPLLRLHALDAGDRQCSCLCILSVALIFIDWPIARMKHGRGRSAVLATVSVISIWITNLLIMWPENLINASAMITYSRFQRLLPSGLARVQAVPEDQRIRHAGSRV